MTTMYAPMGEPLADNLDDVLGAFAEESDESLLDRPAYTPLELVLQERLGRALDALAADEAPYPMAAA